MGHIPSLTSRKGNGSWAEVLLGFVQRYPGVHLRKLIRQLKIPTGTLHHHLSRLSQRGFIETREIGGHRCIFPSKPVGMGPPIPEKDKTLLALLRLRVPRALLLHLTFFGPSTGPELAESAEVSASLLLYYLERLERLGVVERKSDGGGVRMAVLRSPDDVRTLLLIHPPLREPLEDRWLNLWEEMHL